jgi:hypothetical protein
MKLFLASTENANAALDVGLFGVQFNGWYAMTVEASVARHAELREEVHRAFGHDSELLAANLQSLDRAFEINMQKIARHTAFHMEWNRRATENSEHLVRRIEPNALANHRDFNYGEFKRNNMEMMAQFSRIYLEQLSSGLGADVSLQATMDLMDILFSLTKSVSSLSFRDFLYLHANITSGTAKTIDEMVDERNMLTRAFNNSPNLSPELRALLES